MSSRGLTRRDFFRASAGGLAAAAFAACSTDTGAAGRTFRVDDIPYGAAPSQVAELRIPDSATPRPIAVLLHGGYWRTGFDRRSLAPLADDLAGAGYASWNVDYRVIGEPGGGYPGTAEDVAAAIDLLAELAPQRNLDVSRVVVLGHSAGGQLALWAAARPLLPPTAPGAAPVVGVRAAVSLAGVVDLTGAATDDSDETERRNLRGAVRDYLGGGPDEVPAAYAQQDPTLLLPIGVPQLLLHGSADDRVPVDQSRAYVRGARAVGDRATLIEMPDLGHFDVIESRTGWWNEVLFWLQDQIGDPLT